MVQIEKNTPVRRRRVRGDWLAVLAVLTIALWWLTNLLVGDVRLLGYANAFGLWWAILSAIAGVVLLLGHRFALGAIAMLLAAGIASQCLAVNFGSGPSAGRPGQHSFRLVTASLRTLNHDMSDAAVTLLALHPDVLVVQEADVPALINMLDLKSDGGWRYVSRGNEVIACRCVIRPQSDRDHLLSADVSLPGGSVRVWNVRAPKNYDNALVNAEYFASLAEALRDSTVAVAAGDFNATPWNDGYRTIAGISHDAWKQAGLGAGLTFPTPARRMGLIMPLIGIDHVFVKGPLRAVRARVGEASAGADHYPLVIDLVR